MLKMKRKYTLFLFASVLMLTGCNDRELDKASIEPGKKLTSETKQVPVSKTESNENVRDKKEQKDIQPLPQNLNELAQIPIGYTGYLSTIVEEDIKKITELTKDLPDISTDPSKEELDNYYAHILSVFQQDFRGPEDLINQLTFQTIGNPEIEDPRMMFKENLNVMVILDASGSMGKELESQTQMEAAKAAITNFVSGLPENANVGLRIYGHKGTGDQSDKALSCSSSELIYPVGKYQGDSFSEALAKAKPAGWTPIQLALNEAQKDLSGFKGEQNTNIIYLVSDGVSTCDDDPVTAAKELYNSDITPIVNVIGFNVDNEGQKQLRAIADASNGIYEDVQNAQDLQNQLDQAKKVAEKWNMWKSSKEGFLGADRVNNSLDIFVYHSEEFRKWVNEGQQVGLTLTYLFQNGDKMSRESHDYLKEKNISYHKWVEAEYDKLRDELKTLNEMKYGEAIKALEEKYQQNTTD